MINKEIVEKVVLELNEHEKQRLKEEGFTNSAFFNEDGSLTDEYKIHLKEKKKYFYINFGTSGAFMINKEDGEIYNIKGYGQPDFNKKQKADLGNIKTCNTEELHKRKYNYLR